MNPELVKLLTLAGRTPDTLSPSRMVLFNMYGAVPRVPSLHERHAQKGFKVLLLGDDGRPTHVASCADPADQKIELEYRITSSLPRRPELRHLLAPATTACSDRLRVLLCSFMPGRRFDDLERAMSPASWEAAVHAILDASIAVCAAAQAEFPELTASRGDTVTLRAELAPDLVRLAEAGFTTSQLQVVEEAVAGVGPLARTVQYGDLWAGNVLVLGERRWLVDLAEIGRVQVPMFDVIHFLSHSARAPLQATDSQPRNPYGEASRRIARMYAARLGLAAEQAAGVLMFYLAAQAAFRLRPGMSRDYFSRHVGDLARAIDLRRHGVDFTQWLGGDR